MDTVIPVVFVNCLKASSNIHPTVLRTHVANTLPKNISYLQFLSANREISPRLRKIGLLYTVKVEFNDLQYLQAFWSSIIHQRSQLSVKRMFDGGCLNLIEIAGKSQIRGIKCLYLEVSLYSMEEGIVDGFKPLSKRSRINSGNKILRR
ncbi:4176_t:CDS:2 [Acaulospora morrowiae]|uniref:4176_t:CDS:1 n=1 Tax=Acaulospora morrowiae TaxID=94023 RepID=A0A9N8YNQ3_9GLOM|nr:4176_t:CDS:2 [Acaulospora morrowiae]